MVTKIQISEGDESILDSKNDAVQSLTILFSAHILAKHLEHGMTFHWMKNTSEMVDHWRETHLCKIISH